MCYTEISIMMTYAYSTYFNNSSLKMNYALALFTIALSQAAIYNCCGGNGFRAKKIERDMKNS